MKELLPIVIAAAVWGRLWSKARVEAYSDNMAVVQAIRSCLVRCPQLMRLLRALFFVEACFNFSLAASHIVGREKVAADSLSRNNLNQFFCLSTGPYPHTPPPGPPVPPQPASRLAIPELVSDAQHYFDKALSSSSARSYNSAQNCFCRFCVAFNLCPFPL